MQEDQVLKKAIDEWERVSQDPQVLLAYEARRKALLDEKSALRRAQNLGKIEGEKIGEKRGREEAVKAMAIGMVQEGVSNHTISKLTGLSIEEIEKLRHQWMKKRAIPLRYGSFLNRANNKISNHNE